MTINRKSTFERILNKCIDRWKHLPSGCKIDLRHISAEKNNEADTISRLCSLMIPTEGIYAVLELVEAQDKWLKFKTKIPKNNLSGNKHIREFRIKL